MALDRERRTTVTSEPAITIPFEQAEQPSVAEQLALARHAVGRAEEALIGEAADAARWERRGLLKTLRRRGLKEVK
jgi:hypothetical protein